jgi:uncharacterized protein DUF4242
MPRFALRKLCPPRFAARLLPVEGVGRDRLCRTAVSATQGGSTVPEFMDVHDGMNGITPDQLAEAHQADLDIQDEEGVNFKHAWADPKTGKVFCLSEAPNAEAVKRIHERAGHPTDQVFEVPVQA